MDVETQAGSHDRTRTGRYVLAWATLVATFVLIVAGGNVTSKDAGLAVPDWPLSFGSINPQGWIRMPGVRDEHGHRLIGALVGMLLTALTVWIWRSERRRWVVRLAQASWIAVVIQGIMGGLRVTEVSILLAIVHGCFAHAFLCMVLALTIAHGPSWRSQARESEAPLAVLRPLSRWLVVLIAAIFGQLILGAILRHTITGTTFHIAGAIVVGLIVAAVLAVMSREPRLAWYRSRGWVILGLYSVQVALGVGTLVYVDPLLGWVPAAWLRYYLPTTHVAVAALLLGVVFDVWMYAERSVRLRRSLAATAGAVGAVRPA